MSQDAGILDLTFEAGEDLTDKKYRFVKLNSDGKVVASTSSKSVSIGILQSETDTKRDIPAVGQAVRVRLLGTSKLVAGAAFSVGGTLGGLVNGKKGTLITSNADGRGIAANVNQYIGAIALEAAAAPSGSDPKEYEVIEAIITHMYSPGSV